MKTHYKISLVVVALATVLAIIAATQSDAGAIVITFGTVCCLAGVISMILGGIFAFARRKDLSQAFFISAGMTFLLGTGVCSTALLG